MKKYKLLKDLPTLKAGAIFAINDCGTLHYVDKDNSINLHKHDQDKMRKEGTFDEWFKEIEESKVWEPEEGDGYYYINYNGSASFDIYDSGELDSCLFEIGNCFRTQEDAEKTVEKLKALRRLREKGLKFCYHEWNYEDGNNLPIHAKLPWNDYGPEEYDPILKDLNLLFKEESEDEN